MPKDYITRTEFNESVALIRQEMSDFQTTTFEVVNKLDQRVGDVEQKIEVLTKIVTDTQNMLKDFLYAFNKHNAISEKRWEDQRKFNESIHVRVNDLEIVT